MPTKLQTSTTPINVFSKQRTLEIPVFEMPHGMAYNTRLKMDGLAFLQKLPKNSISIAFFDPQYRGILDKMNYGNEGISRGKLRCTLEQMSESTIRNFILHISQCLVPSGHLFLWVDKFHLCSGFASWLAKTDLHVVDMITWHKERMGMGYRTRRTSEHLIVLQKEPKRAKGVWKLHTIPDVWAEKVQRSTHTHTKPVMLQSELIEAVSNPDDIVIDPAAGSFSVLEACKIKNRTFLGCDING